MQKTVLWVLAIIIIIGLGYYLLGNKDAAPAAPGESSTAAGSENAPTTAEATAPVVVTYDGSSFTPDTVTIPKGGRVTFNSTAGDIWVATAAHPSHTVYDGTTLEEHCAPGYTGTPSFDQCSAGISYTYTFNQSGSWKYHNHLKLGAFGTIVVTE